MQDEYILHLLPSTYRRDIRLSGRRLTEYLPRHFVGVVDFQYLNTNQMLFLKTTEQH